MMMTSTLRRHAAKGFTLIELLIVVIIIAILAAIAIPQFSVTSDDAKLAALDANLSNMRSAIELYRVQHKNTVPAKNTSTPATTSVCPQGGTAGNAAVTTEAAFKDQLTAYSNADGGTCSIPAPDFPLGPYLRAIPAEPGSGKTTVAVVATAPAADDSTGWQFSTLTGKLLANNTKDKVGTTNVKYSDR
jgi:prepilin-type N-terminal cleavage/methylation domain-containing protein